MNYLASPPLVVAYALAGTMDVDLNVDPIGHDTTGSAVYLRDLWPSDAEITKVVEAVVDRSMFVERYGSIFEGDERWRALPAPSGERYEWDPESTYIRRPPFLDQLSTDDTVFTDIVGARALALLGDSVTTDHISPAGNIRASTPAGQWLVEHGVEPRDFNSYGARRGNHEVMVRGTFANVRLRNQLAPGTEGGFTVHVPDGAASTIYDASMQYQREGVPLVVIAGKEYRSGSSRDWAAKGSLLLGVRAVMVESYERIHRSNLVGMGVLPLEFMRGESAQSLGLTGHERFNIRGVGAVAENGPLPFEVTVEADDRVFTMRARIDTPFEREVFRAGGILAFTLRALLA
jgi:aconitate hydratase